MYGSSFVSAFCFAALVCFSSVAGATPIEVLVTVPPQKDLVERIGGDAVAVTVMVPRGADPHSYEPKPSQMVAASHARLWFTVGMPMERIQAERVASVASQLKLVAVDSLVEPLMMKETEEFFEDGASHNSPHGPGCTCGHHEGEPDPHSWLSARNALLEAQVIRNELIAADDSNKALYDANYQQFEKEAKALDAKLAHILRDAKGKTFLTFHPTWGYFARDYDLVQLPIEVNGKEPGEKTLIRIIDFARAQGVRSILVQPEFSTQSANVIAKTLDIPVVMLDPLSPDWSDGLVKAAETIAKSVR